MTQNKEFRQESTEISLIKKWSLTEDQRQYSGESTVFSINGAGKNWTFIWKNKPIHKYYTCIAIKWKLNLM